MHGFADKCVQYNSPPQSGAHVCKRVGWFDVISLTMQRSWKNKCVQTVCMDGLVQDYISLVRKAIDMRSVFCGM